MNFKQPVCRLQLIIKNQEEPFKKTSTKHSNYRHFLNQGLGRSLQIRQNCESFSKHQIASQCLKIPTKLEKSIIYADQTLPAHSRTSSQFTKYQQSRIRLQRSMTQLRVKQLIEQQKSKQSTLSQQKVSSSNSKLRKIKQKTQELKLKGIKHSHSQKRPATAINFHHHQEQKERVRPQTQKKMSQNKNSHNKSKRLVLSTRKHGRAMSFNPKDYQQQYQKKLKIFMDYLFKVNFSHGIYIEMQLLPVEAPIHRYKVFVGKGNNHLLIKELLKRRFWYQIVDNQNDCQLIWTQFQLPSVFKTQKCALSKKSQDKANPDFNKSIVCSKTFGFRKQLRRSRTRLNQKFMSRQQAEQVQELITDKGLVVFSQSYQFTVLTNHIPGTQILTVKKSLLKHLKIYYEDVLDDDPFKIIPKSYHFTSTSGNDVDFFHHLVVLDPKKLWILKPAEKSRKGDGIQIHPATAILKRMKQRWQQEQFQGTFIVQSYIQNPLLYYQRKFDIRHYMLLTCINGSLKAYWHREGYVRTSSQSYSFVSKINCRNPQAKKYKAQMAEQLAAWLKNRQIHLTNDIVQKQSEDYGKYQPGNKLSYVDLQKYFDYQHAEYQFFEQAVPKMKEIALNVLKSVKGQIDPLRRACNFQLFGLDYILDQDFNVWLIQVNNNPCYEKDSPVLDRVIPGVLQQVLRFCVDPLLPPRNHFPAKEQPAIPPDTLAALKFQLFYQQ